MKGAQAYVNEQWQASGLASLPKGPECQTITLHFFIKRDAQNPALINQICEVAQQHLCETYQGRQVTHEPITGDVVGDGTGEGINLVFHVGSVE
ncbi:hypothetical protein [Stutzerimonas tarimensis]|uniref:DUF3168 domain-containing protein n=1 Tax=Stutzerimonas tarimensis TaxID=1507735 RepID=A0ABV7T352_9GAMM